MLRGFHSDYKSEHWEPHKAVFEPERNFGFTADGRWISSTGAYTATMVVPGGQVPVAGRHLGDGPARPTAVAACSSS